MNHLLNTPEKSAHPNPFATVSALLAACRKPRNCSAGHFIRRYGLKKPEALRISWFIYLVNGETNEAFVDAMNTWVRETALVTGSVHNIPDAIDMLSVTQIDFDNINSCAAVRREVIRYVQQRFSVPAPVSLNLAA